MQKVKNNKFPRGIELAGGAIIENSKGEILLAKSPKWSNKWTFPSGHIKPGEKIETGIIREVQEEVGLRLKSLGIFSFGEQIDSQDYYRPAHFIFFDIYCKATDNKIKLDKKELTKYLWAKPSQALKMNLAESFDQTIIDFIKFKKNRKIY